MLNSTNYINMRIILHLKFIPDAFLSFENDILHHDHFVTFASASFSITEILDYWSLEMSDSINF